MKKLLLTVLAAFCISGAVAQEAFPDIPAGHWAGDAVTRIADLGIIIGFPDGTFRGNESFTRYQMALVISRLLDVIRTDIDAVRALHESDIASLRNALQELASDLAAQGVRLNAVEGAVASISDDVVSNTARVEAIEAAMNDHMSGHSDGGGGMDADMMAAMQDLQNQVASLRVATDTAQAQADAAAAAAAGASDAAAAASTQARQNSAAIDAINDLLGLLNGDIQGLQGDISTLENAINEVRANMNPPMEPVDTSAMEGMMDDMMGDMAQNMSDIANIREFVILLRRDQVALRDRVAALEAADADQSAAIEDLSARVSAIEDDLLVISGSIGLTYRAYRLSGDAPEFDVDRVWGLNNLRDIGTSNFSSGSDDLNDDGDETDVGEVVQDREDITDREGDTEVDLDLTIGFNTDRNGDGDSRALNSFESVLKLKLTQAYNLDGDEDAVDRSIDDDNFDGYVFAVDSFSTTFSPIGGAPLTFQFGEDISANFTPYIFNAQDDGFVATVGSPDFLAFLDPTLTIAYGEVDDDIDDDGTDDWEDTYYRGIRGTLTPLSGESLSATGGFSYAEITTGAGENADALGDNDSVTVWGVDGQIGVSILDINFEYATESGDIVATDAGATTEGPGGSRSLLYVEAIADVASAGIPLLKSLNANYRDMPEDWFGIFADSDDYPFDLDQSGFKVEGTIGLFIIDVSAYFDSYTVSDTDGDGDRESVTAFGASTGLNLFAGFSLEAYYNSLSVNGAAADSTDNPVGADEASLTGVDGSGDANGVERDDNGYETAFGVKLSHPGDTDNALIPNLNLSVEYMQSEADFSKTTIDVNADYDALVLGPISLTPYAQFKTVTDTDAGADDTTTIRAGTGIATEALPIFLAPSLEGAVNYRTTSHTEPVYTASELQYAVGLSLNEFLFDNSTLRIRYGSWTGTNIEDDTNTLGAGDDATDISGGDEDNGGAVQSTSGYEIVWDYWDLIFAYGVYTNSNDGLEGAAQAFKISYTVNF